MKTFPLKLARTWLAIGCSAAAMTSMAQESFQWAVPFGGPGSDYASGVAVDAAGNSVVAGAFASTMTLAGTTLNSTGDRDVFVAKFSPEGTPLWVVGGHGSGNDLAYSVAVNGAGEIFVTGFYGTTLTLNGVTLPDLGGNDMFLAKFSPAGALIWAKAIGGTGFDQGTWVAADAAGGVYAVGQVDGSITIDGVILPSHGGYDWLVARFDSGGNLAWARLDGGPGADLPWSVATDPFGNVLVTGYFTGTTDVAGVVETSAGAEDLLVVKYTAGGDPLWSRRAGGVEQDMGTSVSADRHGNILLTGIFHGSATLFGKSVASRGDSDLFIAKLKPDGTVLWVHDAGGPGKDVGWGVAADRRDFTYLTGYFNETAQFGETALASRGGSDIFLQQFNPDGTPTWVVQAGGNDVDFAFSLSVHPSGFAVLVGRINTEARFDDLTVPAEGADGYLARIPLDTAGLTGLDLFWTGEGRISPAPSRIRLKEGGAYRIRAIPARGWLFDGWTGSFTESSPLLRFIFQEYAWIHARFVPNPFYTTRGVYVVPLPEESGGTQLLLSLNTKGQLTARARGIRGARGRTQLDRDGTGTLLVPGLGEFQVRLQTEGTPVIELESEGMQLQATRR